MTDASTPPTGGSSRRSFNGAAGSTGLLGLARCVENTVNAGGDGGDGSSPMIRPPFIYDNEASLQRGEVDEYVEHSLENAETNAIRHTGNVPASMDSHDSTLEGLDEMVDY
jgi:hypothetical protein